MKDNKPRVKGQGGVAKQTPRQPLTGGVDKGSPHASQFYSTNPHNRPGRGTHGGGSTHNNLGTP
jgi:hypothetical protein